MWRRSRTGAVEKILEVPGKCEFMAVTACGKPPTAGGPVERKALKGVVLGRE
jgi:hypothetical protein